MMPLSTKEYLTLLWGISFLFSMETQSASLPETSSSNSTAEPNKSSRPLTTAHVLDNEREIQSATWAPTHRPAEVTVAATAETTVLPTMETKEADVNNKSDSSNGSVAVERPVAATASSSGPPFLHTSAALTTAGGDAQPSHNTMASETAKPTEALKQQWLTTSNNVTAPATTSATTSAASSAAVAVFSPQPSSSAKPDVPSKSSSSTTPDDSTQAPHFISSPPASTMTNMATNPASEVAPVFDITSLPVTVAEKSTTSAELSTSQPLSDTTPRSFTSQSPDTTGSSSTTDSRTATVSNDSAISTSAASTSPAGILIPHVPETNPTTRSTPAAPLEVSKSPPSTEVRPCSTRGVVTQCLIAIASLAGLATIFMVSTIILCTKLSARKYKVKKPQEATEMMCISALLTERNYTYTRQRSPVTNGVLVLPSDGDSDEEGGDNLTLSSFLPENYRFV
ncbi:P-selectin glycoprotein ligand 1 [Xiphias gladius]|uniref:P-selectin glycoprotein ligand 1 n=1 Tax=Xiphias gladius TaxID=8245 RepID=UPI001A98D36E|nr:P-selectin glycoprotein ligand 1 [Xiphias gladius]XP_040013641.1 P-selectin glycoprotein ligand 1 [Xiphias gladius]